MTSTNYYLSLRALGIFFNSVPILITWLDIGSHPSLRALANDQVTLSMLAMFWTISLVATTVFWKVRKP